jgi:hypothetical protein
MDGLMNYLRLEALGLKVRWGLRLTNWGCLAGIRPGDRTTKAHFPAAITTTTPTNSF